MRWLLILCAFACCLLGSAQVIENPVFDRTDQYRFRIKKVEITADTTYVYCSYQAEEHSWANISEDTFLEDIGSGIRLPLLKAYGLPFSPQKRHFTDADTILVILYFNHIETNKFNIIENEDEESFNIYGIDINHTYTNSYTSEDISKYFDLANKEEDMENWQSAINYSFKQLEATDYVEGIRSFPSACAMYNLTMQLIGTKEYDKAIKWGNKAIDIISTLPKDSVVLDILARSYGNVGTAYRLLKQIDIASNYEELSLATRRLGDGIGTLVYEQYLTHMATQYYREGNYPKALLYGREVVDIYKSKYENNNYKYGCIYLETLCNLCEFYIAMWQPKEAIKCGNIALNLFNEGVCDDEKGLRYWIYNNLAGALASYNQVDESIKYLEEILKAADSNQIEIHLLNKDKDDLIIAAKSLLASIYLYDKKDTIRAEKEYEDILNVSDNYMVALESLYEINRWRNHDKAMHYLKKAIDVEKKCGIESMSYADLLLKWIRDTWVDVLTQKKGIDSLTSNIHSVVDIIKRHIINTSFNLSRNERKAYWQRYHEIFTWLIPTISGILNTQEANSLAYDASLFYKGLLLLSEKDFKEVIEEGNDNSLTVLYSNYIHHISDIEELYAKGGSSVVIDSLNTIIKEEEYALCQKVSRFNKQYKGTNISWKEVRDALNNQEAAIEIVAYRNLQENNIYYDAYIVGKDYEAPKQFYLCGENELKDCLSADSIDYVELSILIFGNDELQKELKKYKTLYISPTGLMNSIGIEYLPIEGNKCLSDRFNIYRVSSTREVCIHHGPIKIENVCIFGGLDYDSASREVANQERSMFRVSRAVEEAVISRGGFEPLYGSKAEVEMIKDEMTKGKIKSILLYKGADGTEDRFKQLSGSQINILHLSTHGMFIPSDKTNLKRNNNFQFILADEDSIIDKETQSLTRSFLVMSGGNKLLRKEKSQYRKEDEILTSLEISHLDFKDLDIVVLSACQTALGDIDADGVYGLQRAFKKAGANTILMSLDKVDDEATQILMVEFYRNLLKGKSKRQSLKEAQKHLRNVENGKYDDPKYWASFIMLDGLN